MRNYAMVGPKFWIGSTGKRLRAAGMEAQIVGMYLMTSPHANMLGLYYCPIMFIAHETGLGIEGATKGLQRAIEAGFCEYDEASEVVWVVEMAKYQIAESLAEKDLRVKGVQNEYNALPENPYLARFFDKYHDAFWMKNCRGNDSPSKAPSKPLRSQEQEQEQDQEQNNSPAVAGSSRAKKSARVELDFSSWPEQPTDGVLADWKRHRQQKRSPLTQTVVDQFGREAQKAAAKGYTVDEFLAECLARGWQGGKADWLEAKGGAPPSRFGSRNKQASIEEANRLAAEEWLRTSNASN